MVQPIDFNRPVYSAVNISIKKPEVDIADKSEQEEYTTNPMTINNNNGIYNAVKIDIDNPRVNSQPKKIYDYPDAQEIVTYEMLNVNPIAIPEESVETKKLPENTDTEENIEIPAPNYTTVEAEKTDFTEDELKKNSNITALSFHGTESGNKKPEIIPSEPILPKIDISIVSENLASDNKDVQAQQIEEIMRTALMDKENAKEYLVSSVFTDLIKITEEDATKLQGPTAQQIELRKKLIANVVAAEKENKDLNNLPFKLSDKEVELAMELTPMELTERNKEYAIATLGALAELFIEDYESKEGKIVPITDTPGISAIVNALRKDPDPSIKMTAIDSLMLIKRPEYKDELSALFTLAQTDPNRNVAQTAAKALHELN